MSYIKYPWVANSQLTDAMKTYRMDLAPCATSINWPAKAARWAGVIELAISQVTEGMGEQNDEGSEHW